MADDVIRNPKRSTPLTQQPYEPVYVREGIDVPAAPVSKVAPEVKPKNPTPEEMYTSVDNDILDQDGLEVPYENGHIIDNNDYVNFGYESTPTLKKENVKVETNETDEELEVNVTSPKVGDYILMVLGKLITSGSLSKIEEKVKNIMYGDDKDFASLEINADDIVVLKRMNIRVGIFIDG